MSVSGKSSLLPRLAPHVHMVLKYGHVYIWFPFDICIHTHMGILAIVCQVSNFWTRINTHLCETFQIPLDRYLPTWRGNVIDAKMEMNPSRIVGMSLSVNAGGGFSDAKSGPGDFRLEIDWIKALRTTQ